MRIPSGSEDRIRCLTCQTLLQIPDRQTNLLPVSGLDHPAEVQPVQNPYATGSTTPEIPNGQPPSVSYCWSLVAFTFVGSTVLTVVVYLLSSQLAVVLAAAVIGIGSVVTIVSAIRIVVLAFKRDVSQGLMCVVFPFYVMKYMFRDWQRTWFTSMFLLCATIAMLGCASGMILGFLVDVVMHH
ncbi:hypothetical protein [Stieleria varia]|uniref:Transmembrane protein n=1 Tax=Stieleria varia TaxID=2528005 RepID=A0A5C6A443_9BACT|nr:hypothetical protein [Stieleria varia]TWT94682.1 hypothetical protein Pla52n_55070 [Stieleria varia]